MTKTPTTVTVEEGDNVVTVAGVELTPDQADRLADEVTAAAFSVRNAYAGALHVAAVEAATP